MFPCPDDRQDVLSDKDGKVLVNHLQMTRPAYARSRPAGPPEVVSTDPFAITDGAVENEDEA